ncbi:permease prefix domain 1-containing protein [Roseimaritima ulvae]|uniref:Uncharacterized protein n=1 Tax=Roseimaritima ulvae TaxID=980254 RepID=A0A5B9QSJ7_9BACT|nr:permease prefix domain 1-containing protein [Roseimaritima ulvae]QEG41964.1 hypothetical protein UC8_39930 [Roseimaritima ulvae]
MSKLISEQLLQYLETLERSLRMPPEQARPVVDEVRDDLLTHVQRRVERGQDESQAVAAAIEEMGPPEQLAAELRVTMPPMGHASVRVLRRAAAIFLTMFLLWVGWHVRAMDFGFSLPRAVAYGVLLTPIALLIWPDLIWRKNWMFTVVPTVVIFFLSVLVMSVGQTTYTVMEIDPQAAPVIPDVRKPSGGGIVGYSVLGMLLALTVYLFSQIQRRRQRWLAFGFSLLLVAAIEGPYAVEEYRYSQQLRQTQASLQTLKDERGSYPAEVPLEFLATPAFHYNSQADGTVYSLFWDRPLSPGYAIGYSSQDNRMWIND